MSGMLERMLESSAEAGVMSSVLTLSPALSETGTRRCWEGGSGTGRNLMLGPRTTSTLAASSDGSGARSRESSTG